MKFYLIVRLLVVFLLFVSCATSAAAIELPFIGYGENSIIVDFAESDNESYLKPIIVAAIKNSREKQIDVRQEVNLINKILRSEGFYDGSVTADTNKDVPVYHIKTGNPYILQKIELITSLENMPKIETFGINQGGKFKAKEILNAISAIKKYIDSNYCLYEINVDYDATVIHPTQQAQIKITVKDSQAVRFFDISFSNLKTIDEDYLRDKIGFNKEDCFKRSLIDKAKLNMLQTGLISNVETKTELQPDDEAVSVDFAIQELKHRTIKAGGGFSSDEGLIVSSGWENRNIFGEGQKLEVNGRVSELYKTAATKLTIPYFLSKKQALVIDGKINQENLDAYSANDMEASAIVSRKVIKYLSVSGGARLKLISIDDNGKSDVFGLVSFPVTADYDKRDNLLDPKKGWLLSAKIEPFVDTLDTRTSFVKATGAGITYYSLENIKYKPTIALRGAIGSINGQNINDIPADERFYAGGGGSVRGYSFQKLGPLSGDKPLGGRSFAEVSFEARLRFNEKWGGVAFIDGGNAYNDISPDFSEGLRFAYGAGVRYYTSFAPIRFDIALPIDYRENIDDRYQYYISIGQAF